MAIHRYSRESLGLALLSWADLLTESCIHYCINLINVYLAPGMCPSVCPSHRGNDSGSVFFSEKRLWDKSIRDLVKNENDCITLTYLINRNIPLS